MVAREVGPNKLSASSLITVNLLDSNDNKPVFTRDKYEVSVHENEVPGKVILKVRGFRAGADWRVSWSGQEKKSYFLRIMQNLE